MNEEKETMKSGWNGCCGGRRWFLIPLFIIAAIVIFGAVVMYLWNAVMPHVFTSLGPITYCQAIGLLILSRIFFGGFRKGGGRHKWGKSRHYGSQCKEKWMSMSEEERGKFKEEWKNRCC